MSTVAIYSLKGGVGKTTLSVNLAWCAAVRSARRTLLWDLDPQAASTWLLGDATTDGPSPDSAQAMFSKDIAVRRNARPTAYPNLDLIGADASLRSLDRFFHDLDKKKRLAKLLEGLADYDRIILDCAPGLTETADQVMRGADLIVIPVIPSPLSTRAYEAVIRHLGGKTPVLPVHMMVDRRRKLHADALALHPDWPVIPMASMIEMMASKRAPIGAFAPQSAAAQAFADLWRAIEHKLAELKQTP